MNPRERLVDQLSRHEVVAVLGPGGVGKTTLSAALAMLAARERRTLLVTIDPAKRLASALGLALGHEISNVRGNLDAVMVDTKRALDDMMREYAPDREKLDTILDSQLYTHLSSALVGSEEFAAMGLLHEFYKTDEYELIVVDTPPAKHALDFLTVNKRLLRVFESGLTRWVFQPGKLFSVAGGRMAKVLARWTSREYLDTLSDFMLHFEDMFYEMEGRVRTMDDLLMDPSRTGLGLVAVPDAGAVGEALSLCEGVSELGLDTSFVIANRVYLPLAGSSVDGDQRALLDHYARLAGSHCEGIGQLESQVGQVVVVPALAAVTGLDGVERLASYLGP